VLTLLDVPLLDATVTLTEDRLADETADPFELVIVNAWV